MVSLDELIKVKRTQLEMLHDRGYDVTDEEPMMADTITITDFMKFYNLSLIRKNKYGDLLSQVYVKSKENPDIDRYYVYYAIDVNKAQLPKSSVETFADRINENNCSGGIIISEMLGSGTANAILQGLASSKRHRIQHYLIDELLYNPSKHIFVPRHYVLTQEEKDKFYKANRYVSPRTETTTDDMPEMRLRNLHLTNCWKYASDSTKMGKCGDPIAKYYAMKVGDVVEIQRELLVFKSEGPEPMVMSNIFFRRVVGY
jgi:DNA-directed RNA polymerase subunit H (RpoH/RPB5)